MCKFHDVDLEQFATVDRAYSANQKPTNGSHLTSLVFYIVVFYRARYGESPDLHV